MKRTKRVLEANRVLIQSTSKVSQDTLSASMKIVDKLTHPPKKIARVGSVIGGSIGVGLVFVGAIGLILERSLWASGIFIAGAVTITSNVVSLKRIKEGL